MLDGLGDAGANLIRELQSVDDEVETRALRELRSLRVDPHFEPVGENTQITSSFPGRSASRQQLPHVVVVPAGEDRRDEPARPSVGVGHDPPRDFRSVRTLELLAVRRTTRSAGARPQDAQVVVDLRRRRDRRTRLSVTGARFHGDRGAQTFDALDGRAILRTQELPRVRRQRFDEASATLGIDRVQRERALARTARSRDDDELVARDVERDVLQVVRPRTDDAQDVRALCRYACEFALLGHVFARAKRAQCNAGVRARDLLDRLGCAFGQHVTAAGTTFGAEVEHVIRREHEVEVVLDDDDGVAAIDQGLEGLHEPCDVGQVQAGRGLVEDVEHVPGRLALQFRRKLETLRFTARERRRRLTEREVTEAHVHEDRERSRDLRMVGEQRVRVFDRHREDVGDRGFAIVDVERRRLESMPAALLARHGDGSQELEFDVLRAGSSAGLAATAGHVERETRLRVAAQFRFGHPGEKVADPIENTGVRRRIRTRRPADRRSVDRDEGFDVLESRDLVVRFRCRALEAELAARGALQDPVHERRLARTADTGDDGQRPEREARVDVLQVEGARALHHDRFAIALATRGRRFERDLPAQQSRGRRVELRHLGRRPLRDDATAVTPGARADVDEPIGGSQSGVVVLDDDDRVARVAQRSQRAEQTILVACVQADGRLVEDVEHSLQSSAELRRETDALCLSARQRLGRSIERQVAQTHLQQEVDAPPDLLQEIDGDACFTAREFERTELRGQVLDRQSGDDAEPHIAEEHRVRSRIQATARARGARFAREEPLGRLLVRARLRGFLDGRQDAAERPHPAHFPCEFLARPSGLGLESLLTTAGEDHALSRARQILPRCVEVETRRSRHLLQEVEVHVWEEQRAARCARHRQRSGADGEGRVCDDRALGRIQALAETFAIDAGTVRRVEREEPRLERRHIAATTGARATRRIRVVRTVAGHDHVAAREIEGLLESLTQALEFVRARLQSIDDGLDRVTLVAFELGHVFDARDEAIDASTHEALLAQPVEQLLVLTLAIAHERREQHHVLARAVAQHLLDDVLGGLRTNGQLAVRAVRSTGARVEDAQVIDDLRQGPDRRARPALNRLLIDGDRRRETRDRLDVGLLHVAQELARVRRERLEETPLSLAEQRVEGQRRLARAGDSGDRDEAIPR